MPPRSGDTQRILEGFRRLVRELRVTSRAAEDSVGLSGAQLFVLQRLAESPSASLNDLAARTMTHQSSVSVVVERLVAKGLVKRAKSTTDARRRELAITPKGRTLLGKSPELAQDRLIAAVASLTPASRRVLARSLSQVIAAMGLDEEKPAGLFFEEKAAARKR